jgi:hypothetical protein
MGLLLAGLWIVGLAVGVAITLALVGTAARRSGLPGAFTILLGYAFAWGLFIWAGLFVIALASWDGWQ